MNEYQRLTDVTKTKLSLSENLLELTKQMET